MTSEEKAILLGALFHDIGKFEQRVLNRHIPHSELGKLFVENLKDKVLKILENDENAFQNVKEIIAEHHNKNSASQLVNTVRTADHLSASERVDFDEEDNWQDKWSHKFLTSLFSKIYLNETDTQKRKKKYYAHKLLTEKHYKIIIPEYEEESNIKKDNPKYPQETFDKFIENVKSVLSLYETENDFAQIINLLLTVFEKYMWCIPDFTGSENTDISLYNHLKDVAGLSQAIFKSDKNETKLNLIIGDLPGIQKYIFNVAYKKPAKVLRGRSIYVQILTRRFATMILNKLGLTDANLIMLAGGKFYIVAQNSSDFESKFHDVLNDIDKILERDFNFQLSFSAVAHKFDYENLKNKKITFGDVIDDASYKLLQKRNKQFESIFFNYDYFDENKFVLPSKYIENEDSNKVKCAVTDLPIREDRKGNIEGEQVDKQVENEYKVGSLAPKNNLVIEFSEDYSEVLEVNPLSEYKKNSNPKILLNPFLDELLKTENRKKDVLRNSQIIEVANYVTKARDKNEKTLEKQVMDFEQMETYNNGAQMMTLIKGDVDNLGLIMSSGLVGNKDRDSEKGEPKDLTGISRTTTLSNHLKYFFSFSLNGFLEDWEKGKIGKTVEDNFTDDQKVYTVFAGGDDLMIICPQSSSLKLLNELNKTFEEFVCENPEVHISYSLTNFKHNTPIRIVADMAEENQSEAKVAFKNKNILEEIKTKSTVFYKPEDKAALRLFDTNLKNVLIDEILRYKYKHISWVEDDSNKMSQGVLRNLLYFSKIMKDFRETGDTRFIMWHPKLTYLVNRVLKNSNGEYYNNEVGEFVDTILSINKGENPEAIILEQIIYPVVCEAIYGTRKTKKGE